jgi:DTW domain-containing protein YfiP
MRPSSVCWCALVPKIRARTKLVVLQHPREEFMPIGTARMAALAVEGAELVVGTALDAHPIVCSALDDADRQSVLLWPGPASVDIRSIPIDRPVTLIVVDGTWALARKLVRLNPRLAALPQVRLSPSRPSDYRIRREPAEGCVSTVEAVIEALGLLDGSPDAFEAMRAPFRAMVDRQIAFADARTGAGRHKPKGPKRPPRTPRAFADGRDVVVLSGEQNAWPVRMADRPAQELVHVAAVRLSGGARTDALDVIIAPRGPLAPTTAHHARIEEAAILAGTSMEAFLATWRSFVREDDVIAYWGPHAVGLLAAAGGFVPGRRVDLRRAALDWLRAKSPSIVDACTAMGLTSVSIARGRAGARLGAAASIAEHLIRAARQPVALEMEHAAIPLV